ncbi:MAG: DUF4260 domain-containing protein [Polyangiaceae bacterium]
MSTTFSLPRTAEDHTASSPASHASAGARSGATRGAVRVTLRLEGAALFTVAVALFHALGGGWALFAVLFLVPDVSMVGYLVGARFGAALYNAGHSLLGPLALGALGFALVGVGSPLILVAAIWVAHVGFDRMLGYGLKYSTGFRETHLSSAAS